MSLLLPLLMSSWLADYPPPMMNRDIGLQSNRLASPIFNPIIPLDFWPWMDLVPKDNTVRVTSDKNALTIQVNMKNFKLNETSVKVVDRCLIIEAKHNDETYSSIFVKYCLPNRADVDEIKSTLSDDTLTIHVPLKEIDKKVKTIPIKKIEKAPPSDTKDKRPDEVETGTTISTEKKTENEMQEELTTQGQKESEA